MNRVAALSVVAFLAGAALSGLLFYEEGSVPRALGAVLGTDARVVVRVENVGTHDLATAITIRKAGGGEIFADSWVTPAGGVRSRVLEGRLAGDFLAHGSFSWAEGGRRGAGDSTQRFAGAECGPGESILVVFRVDSTNGVSFDGPGVYCNRV